MRSRRVGLTSSVDLKVDAYGRRDMNSSVDLKVDAYAVCDLKVDTYGRAACVT